MPFIILNRIAQTILITFTLLMSFSAHAKMLWSDVSISLLTGSDYKIGDEERTVMTVEHASGHSWGDNFFFMDRLSASDGSTETYAEIGPRLSLSKLTGSTIGGGPIADVLIATQWEMVDVGAQADNYLVGIGLDWNIPGFMFFQTNLYMRQNDSTDKENSSQLTITWALPFEVGGQKFLFDGFMDYATEVGKDFNNNDTVASMNFTPQLKWNMSDLFGWTNQAYVGVEYVYWTNKFNFDSDIDGADQGIYDSNESNPNLLLKVHFK